MNANGKLRTTSQWEFKLSASVDLPWDLEGSFFYTYLSGEYWTPEVDIDGLYRNSRNNTVFLTPRGSEQLEDYDKLDLRLAKSFNLGGNLSLKLIVDVFNVLNANAVTDIDEFWGYYVYDYTDHPDGSFWDGPLSTYPEPTDVQNPREIRLGLRFSF